MADVWEKDLAQKTLVTAEDYVRVVGTDNVSYKQKINTMPSQYAVVSGTDLLGYIKSLGTGTYFIRMDGVSGLPSGGIVYRIVKTHGTNDARCSIIAIPMNSDANVYTTFITSASATAIEWKALPLCADTWHASANLNDDYYKKTGFFWISSNPTNAPTGLTWFPLIVIARVDTVRQIIIGNNSTIYTRTFQSNAWYSWVKQPTRAEIDALNSNTTWDITFNSSYALGSGYVQRYGKICVLSATVKILTTGTNMVCAYVVNGNTNNAPNVSVWCSCDLYYGASRQAEARVASNGELQVSAPGGMENSDLKIFCTWIAKS